MLACSFNGATAAASVLIVFTRAKAERSLKLARPVVMPVLIFVGLPSPRIRIASQGERSVSLGVIWRRIRLSAIAIFTIGPITSTPEAGFTNVSAGAILVIVLSLI